MQKLMRKGAAWLKTVCCHAEFHSKDPNTKVAAAIIRPDWSLVSMGYNGMPLGTADTEENWARHRKYDLVLHAEVNALRQARENTAGYMLVCNLFPCHRCAGEIAQAGIKTLIYSGEPREDQKCELATQIMNDAGISMIRIEGIAKVRDFQGARFDRADWE
jgi:dCMP deaminase